MLIVRRHVDKAVLKHVAEAANSTQWSPQVVGCGKRECLELHIGRFELLGSLAHACFQLLMGTNVLERDRGAVGEGLQKLHLVWLCVMVCSPIVPNGANRIGRSNGHHYEAF